MHGAEQRNWANLVVESGAHPPPLSDERFRGWMAGRQIFVSSTMDDEMGPFREDVRTYLHKIGATPVMWEEITPRDESAQNAYLSGVDRSRIFILLLGSRYGVTDSSGYSPTHQEAKRAAERKIPRLLFTLATVKDSDRDGRLNDWLRSLYAELSGASFTSSGDLIAQLDARFREMAARGERLWIKLGHIVFPGKVATNFEGAGSGQFVVTATVGTGAVRRSLLELGQPFGQRSRVDRLTWSDQSYPIQVESVSSTSEFTTESDLEIKCRTPQNWYGHSGSTLAMLGAVGSVSQAEMAEMWARRAILGEDYQRTSREVYDMVESVTAPETLTLPELLMTLGASSWLAEGLTGLYVVEEVNRRYGGHFQHLEIGPATATGIGIDGAFVLGSGTSVRASLIGIRGVVPLRK